MKKVPRSLKLAALGIGCYVAGRLVWYYHDPEQATNLMFDEPVFWPAKLLIAVGILSVAAALILVLSSWFGSVLSKVDHARKK